MSLQTRLTDFVTAVATDYKQLRVWLTGSSTGTLASLLTTDKTSIVNAINEIKSASVTVPAASESTPGIAAIAATADMNTGTDDTKFATPLKVKAYTSARFQPVSANLLSLSGFTTSTDGTLAANSDTVIPSQKAIKAYADGLLDANNAYVYKGALDASTNPNYPAASAGWTYKVSVAGRLGGASGVVVEVGDTATCLVDGSVAGTQAAVGANWLVTQTNIDGAVVGPASSVAGDIATFSGTTGKVVADSGLSSDTDGTLASNSNTKLPTSAAVRTYVAGAAYSKTALGDPETDLVAVYTTNKA